MAIDTAAKRRYAACFKAIIKSPLPSGTIGAATRAHVAWTYAGIDIGAPYISQMYRVMVITGEYRQVKAFTSLHRKIKAITTGG